jgi:hypothetical protein
MTDYFSTSVRAERGALLLDDSLPGWAAHVRASRIDMADPTSCVLGQLMSHDARVYEHMLLMMHPDLAEASRGTYHGAKLVAFGRWPSARQFWEHGFDGCTWATVRGKQVNLLDGAWFAQVEQRGLGR